MNKLKGLLGVYVRGIAMGAADVIPGVSGGTIAFITGIHETLINALNEVDMTAVKMLFKFQFKALEKKLNGRFLIALTVGIFTAVLSLARIIKYLLGEYPEAVWAFFFGLIIASIFVIAKEIKQWSAGNIIALVIGAVIAYLLTISDVIKTPNTGIYIYMAGVISIMAMILPGISGSFILVILDKYAYIIDLISSVSTGLKGIISALLSRDTDTAAMHWEAMELMPILIFQMGTLTGIIGFSKVLTWLFKKYYAVTIALLTGFLIGSLNGVWPWKNVLTYYNDSHGNPKPLLEENTLPASYDSYFFLAVILAILGFLIVYFMERYSSKKKEISEAS